MLNLLRDWIDPTSVDCKLIRNSPLFNSTYYINFIGKDHDINALRHFCGVGWKLGFNPSPFFDVSYYINRYSDVRKSKKNPLSHYLKYGAFERRQPSPDFNVQDFCDHHPEASHPGVNPAEFCIKRYGSYDWRGDGTTRGLPDEQLDFDTITKCRELFDSTFYTSTYSDVIEREADPFAHFMTHGYRENRDPFAGFDTYFYRHKMMPASISNQNPLVHYVRLGQARNVRTCPASTTVLSTPKARKAEHSAVSQLRVCAHAHCFYPELLGEMLPGLSNLPSGSNVVFTVVSSADQHFAEKYIEASGFAHPFEVRTVPNRGRDLAPFLVGCKDFWADSDLVLHIHTKESPHTTWGRDWRRYLFDQMLGSTELVDAIISKFAESQSLGMFYPSNFYRIKEFTAVEANAAVIQSLLSRLDPTKTMPSDNEYAAGSMAWFRTDALSKLTDMLKEDMFGDEDGSVDGTLAHALERLLPFAVKLNGFEVRNYVTSSRTPLTSRSDSPGRMGFEAALGSRWLRDTPKIALRPPLPLEPQTMLYNAARLNIHWVIPSFGGPGAGGHMTIFRMVNFLERFGHKQTIWLQNAHGFRDQLQPKQQISAWYQPIGDQVDVLFLPDDVRALAGDVIIATDCWTAFPVAEAQNFKERFYFIQDNEPSFHPAGENQLIADLTYQFGFAALCAGDWLLGLAEARGAWARGWSLASDERDYFPGAVRPIDPKPVSIAFYARQYTPRRAVRLGLAALEELHRRGLNMQVHLFGENNLTFDVAFPFVSHGVMSPSELGELYRRCDLGLVFSATNYSLIPLEMMACGLPVVELDVPSTRAIFKNEEVSFAKPTPYDIADAVEELMQNSERRRRQTENAFAYVSRLSWEKSARAVESALKERLREVGARELGTAPTSAAAVTAKSEIPAPALVSHKKASVFIPTYNAGAEFRTVLEAITSQTTDFDFDVLVIDSGSSDETCDIVRSYISKNVRLIEIPNFEFQHGRTRNLGIANTQGDYVAILTQDALPKDNHWLASLIGGFALGDNVAGVIGRHEAYPAHDMFTKRDMNQHFDALGRLPPVISLDRNMPSFILSGSEPWRMLTMFYSDNNSAMSRAVWSQLPYPEIDWGEDQVWASEMLRLGFQKAYVSNAIVYHSHQFHPTQQYKVAETEGRFWAQHFGIKLHDEADEAINTLNARDRDFAIQNGISAAELKSRTALNRALVNGRIAGWTAAQSIETDGAICGRR